MVGKQKKVNWANTATNVDWHLASVRTGKEVEATWQLPTQLPLNFVWVCGSPCHFLLFQRGLFLGHMTYVEAQGSHSEGPTLGVKFNATNLKFPVFFFFFLKMGWLKFLFLFLFLYQVSPFTKCMVQLILFLKAAIHSLLWNIFRYWQSFKSWNRVNGRQRQAGRPRNVPTDLNLTRPPRLDES